MDDEGYPDPKKCGQIRYFVVIDGDPVFRNTREQLIEEFPNSCYVNNRDAGTKILVPPKSFTFIGATIFDNPALIEANPNYLAELQSLPNIERARLLDGNWYARPKGSNYFERDWLVKVDKVPLGCLTVRAWDKAAKEPSEKDRYPDYTASTKLSKCKDGFYYITGNYITEGSDLDSEIIGRFRKRCGERDKVIERQSRSDGSDCIVVLACDPGSAGISEFQASSMKLLAEGFVVKKDPMAITKTKVTKYHPFASACENGLVRIVESSFPNKATLDQWYKENESFSEERSSTTRKDDWPDSVASAFNYLCKEKVIPKFNLSACTRDITSTSGKQAIHDINPIRR